jgi:hypothetical protein
MLGGAECTLANRDSMKLSVKLISSIGRSSSSIDVLGISGGSSLSVVDSNASNWACVSGAGASSCCCCCCGGGCWPLFLLEELIVEVAAGDDDDGAGLDTDLTVAGGTFWSLLLLLLLLLLPSKVFDRLRGRRGSSSGGAARDEERRMLGRVGRDVEFGSFGAADTGEEFMNLEGSLSQLGAALVLCARVDMGSLDRV